MLTETSPVDINAPHPSVTERYYTPKYKIDVVRKGEDHQILLHSNRVCVVTLAETHPILANNKEVTKVDFKIDQKTNRMKNKVSGKGKKGAQWLQDESPLCRVTCSDGTTYTIRSCINASLLEVNTRLIEQPQLLHQKPNSSGYVALALTGLKEHERVINRLLTREQYLAAIDARNSAGNGGSSTESSAENPTDKKSSTLEGNSKDDAGQVESKDSENTENSSVIAEDSKAISKQESDQQGQQVDSTDSKCTDSETDAMEPCSKKARLEEDKTLIGFAMLGSE